jgi:hypothetical protein
LAAPPRLQAGVPRVRAARRRGVRTVRVGLGEKVKKWQDTSSKCQACFSWEVHANTRGESPAMHHQTTCVTSTIHTNKTIQHSPAIHTSHYARIHSAPPSLAAPSSTVFHARMEMMDTRHATCAATTGAADRTTITLFHSTCVRCGHASNDGNVMCTCEKYFGGGG